MQPKWCFSMRVAMAALLCCTIVTAHGAEAHPTNRAAQLHAAFLYKIAGYIRWPDQAARDSFVVQVTNSKDLSVFKAMLKDKRLHNQSIAVEKRNPTKPNLQAQVLFLKSDDPSVVAKQLKECRNRSILTVGASPGFAQKGGCINFYRKRGTLRFEINVDALRRANLKASSQLLKLARIVHDERREE